MKVAVFGLGYVGAVTAACLASDGHDVYGVDVDARKVATINDGRGPVIEPGLDDLIAGAVEAGRLRATTDAAVAVDGADISLICVGTPSARGGGANLTYLRRCLDDIARGVEAGRPPGSGFHAVVVRSTVPPGTVDELVQPRVEAMSGNGWSLAAGMCPEFLREGTGLQDFFSPSLSVLGTRDPRTADAVSRLFAFLSAEIHVVDTPTAESVKYAANAFHATKISFANEMGRLLRPLGVDSRKVMGLLCEDHVLNISPAYLRPGFAYGGSCLPKDLRSLVDLARQNSLDVPLLTGTAATNELVIRETVDRVVDFAPREIALLGLSFKPNTDDLRESPSLELAERLVGKGFELRVYDSVVNPDRLTGSNRTHLEERLPHIRRLLRRTPEDALAGVDLAIVATGEALVVQALTANPELKILDLSGRLGSSVESLDGYEGVGW